jgi:hypothetical protein
MSSESVVPAAHAATAGAIEASGESEQAQEKHDNSHGRAFAEQAVDPIPSMQARVRVRCNETKFFTTIWIDSNRAGFA